MTLLLAASVGVWIGRSLREGFFMFWETLWPLVLGFGLSGAVQAFVPKEQMERAMGDHRRAAVVRASGLGMVSSSCSYAATAMAKSVFQKGADFVTANQVGVYYYDDSNVSEGDAPAQRCCACGDQQRSHPRTHDDLAARCNRCHPDGSSTACA